MTIKNFKSLLLISSLLLLTNCAGSVPQPPQINHYVPIWTGENVSYWHGYDPKSKESWNIPNKNAKVQGMLCMDLDSYNRTKFYTEQLKAYASRSCNGGL